MTISKVGFGPHPLPWPSGDQYDAELLEHGDHRNVIDRYRYWTVEAIKADLDQHRINLEIAVENLTRDFNMGTIIRNANAFNVRKVHIIGSRQWNKRGAMKTDVYVHLEYHQTAEDFLEAMRKSGRDVIAVDIIEESIPLSHVRLPENAVLVFGSEGEGLSDKMLKGASKSVNIEQSGSTRSINVGVASGIAMYVWMQQHN